MHEMEQIRRTIKIYVHPRHGREETLRQLGYGVEEESVPYEIEISNAGDATALAWQASLASRLDVGIGLDRDKLVLNYEKLSSNQPLYVVSARSPVEQVRAVGANAARLVKRLPFKPLKEESGR